MERASQKIIPSLSLVCRPALKAQRIRPAYRTFYAAPSRQIQQQKDPFRIRLRTAWRDTKVQWYAIPATAGIAFLGARQLYKVSENEKAKIEEEREAAIQENGENGEPGLPRKRKRIRPSGPW
jgi:phosphatidylserine decarboxylase